MINLFPLSESMEQLYIKINILVRLNPILPNSFSFLSLNNPVINDSIASHFKRRLLRGVPSIVNKVFISLHAIKYISR